MSQNNEFVFKLIKFLDIGLLGIYYLFGAIIMVSVLNVVFKKIYKDNKENEVKKVSNLKLILQIAIQAAVVMILSNILRKTVRSIPYPLEGVMDYNHLLTKETNGGIIISFAMLTAFTDFKIRVFELVNRFSKVIE
jgi:Na+-transporting NADH:ubiquinone oxidoreductase subunit NqrE